jgi:hypothetical protein
VDLDELLSWHQIAVMDLNGAGSGAGGNARGDTGGDASNVVLPIGVRESEGGLESKGGATEIATLAITPC